VSEKSSPEFIKAPVNVYAKEYDNARVLVKIIGHPKPTGIVKEFFFRYFIFWRIMIIIF